MKNFVYRKPADMSELLSIKGEEKEKAILLAGGTNLMVYIRDGIIKEGTLVSLREISELSGISQVDGSLEIGACETIASILQSPTVSKAIPFITEAVEKFANPLVRNTSTIGGNIADGSPIADTAPVLLVLRAEAVVRSKNGERKIPMEAFFTGPGETSLKPDEVLVKISIPIPKSGTGKFVKLGLRRGTSCSVSSAAAWVVCEGDTIKDIRVALGGVAPMPMRAYKAEAVFKGKSIQDRAELEQLSAEVKEDVNPITDVRGSAEYRREVSVNLVKKAVAGCMGMED